MENEERGGTSGIIAGAVSGALAMYLLDPERGRRRRAMLRDQMIHLAHQVRRDIGVIGADLLNRGKGLMAEVRASLRLAPVPDEIVKERVRAALGRGVSHPHAVHVDVSDGYVKLTGSILEEEVPALMAMAGTVRGVKDIADELQRGERGQTPSLQGGRPRRAWKPDVLQTNQSPATRFIIGAAGAELIRRGMRRGGFLGTLSGIGGAAMLTRAVTNMDFTRLFGTSEQEVMQFNKTIDIHAPVEEVFDFWRNLENLPKIMEGLQDVQMLDDVRSRWTGIGPAGIPVRWNARITKVEPNKRISWVTEQGSSVSNSGHMYFQRLDDNGTRLQVHLAYCPPLGAIGHAAASLLLSDPKHRFDTDLLRFKSLMEDGKTTAKGQEISKEQLKRQPVVTAEPEKPAGGAEAEKPKRTRKTQKAKQTEEAEEAEEMIRIHVD